MQINAKKGVVIATTVLISLFLVGCATGHADQDRIRGFPYQPFPSVSDENGYNEVRLPATGLAFSQSSDRSYPDFYVFIDRNMSEVLFKQAILQFTQLTAVLDSNKVAGFDAKLLERLRELLVFRPGTDGAVQAILYGDLPMELTRAAMLVSGKFSQRYVPLGNRKPAYAMENLAEGIHFGLIDDGCIVIQIDDKPRENEAARSKNFTLLVQRAILLKAGKFNSILNELYASDKRQQEVAKTSKGESQIDENGNLIEKPVVPVSIENAGVKTFDQVLINEVPRPALFALASLALPPTSPATGVRFRVEPVLGQNAVPNKILVELSLKLRDPSAGTQLRAGLKLALASLASMAGLDSSFLETVKIDVKSGELIITGIEMSESHAGDILGMVMSQASVLWSGGEVSAEQPAADSPK